MPLAIDSYIIATSIMSMLWHSRHVCLISLVSLDYPLQPTTTTRPDVTANSLNTAAANVRTVNARRKFADPK